MAMPLAVLQESVCYPTNDRIRPIPLNYGRIISVRDLGVPIGHRKGYLGVIFRYSFFPLHDGLSAFSDRPDKFGTMSTEPLLSLSTKDIMARKES